MSRISGALHFQTFTFALQETGHTLHDVLRGELCGPDCSSPQRPPLTSAVGNCRALNNHPALMSPGKQRTIRRIRSFRPICVCTANVVHFLRDNRRGQGRSTTADDKLTREMDRRNR